MKRSLLISPLAALAVLWGGVMLAEDRTITSTTAERIARGRHIVEGVAMCTDCHTAMLASGEPDLAHAYMGSTLLFRPTIEIPWAEVAPQIAGLPTMSDADAIHFFMSGERPGGVPPRAPMPRYKMARDEAEAVVAFLRSVPPVE